MEINYCRRRLPRWITNYDKMTDHFIVISSKTETLDKGKETSTTYNYFDPRTKHKDWGHLLQINYLYRITKWLVLSTMNIIILIIQLQQLDQIDKNFKKEKYEKNISLFYNRFFLTQL